MCTGGCAVIDGIFNACGVDDDCDYAEVCTMEGCKYGGDLGNAAYCNDDRDCDSMVLGQGDVVCPAKLTTPWPGSCACFGGYCAAEVGVACEGTSDCLDGQYCHKADGLCYRPYECTFHEDCSSGLCTTEGCSDSDDAHYCSDVSDCADSSYSCASYDCECLNGHCYSTAGASCSLNSDCGNYGWCSAEDGGKCRTIEP
jgi:hypothetical protein